MLIHRFAAEGVIGEMDCVYSAWSSDAADGFGEAAVAALKRLAPFLKLALKSAALARMAGTLAETYLGRDAGRRVMSGRIVRGVAEKIGAVLWYSDLHGYTHISDNAPPEQIIPLLNDYADVVISAVHGHGGDVLKLVGDGTLAIFTTENRQEACLAALAAAAQVRKGAAKLNQNRSQAGLPTTAVYLALHVGDVFYGNVGSKDRLDFTVIGPAVNEVSRILAMSRSVEQDLLLSASFADALGPEMRRPAGFGRPLRVARRRATAGTLHPGTRFSCCELDDLRSEVGVGGSNPLARSNFGNPKSRGEPRLFVSDEPRYN